MKTIDLTRELSQLRDEWAERLRRLNPLEVVASEMDAALQEESFQRDPAFLERILRLMEPFNRWFDAEVRGLERVPAAGPVLLVGNHSGGALTPDTSALFAAWYRHFGLDRVLTGLAFDLAFAAPGFGTLMRKIGQVPASSANAQRALEAGDAVIVYPGGDYDAYRPWRERNQIDFGGRQGFIRLALRTGVPVVPVVGHGGHESLIVLARGDALAKRLGLGRLRVDIAPLTWQMPWGLTFGMWPYIPLPVKVTLECCEPIDWSRFGPEAADDPEIVDRCYAEISARMQDKLTELAARHPIPLLSRLQGLLPSPLGTAFQRDD